MQLNFNKKICKDCQRTFSFIYIFLGAHFLSESDPKRNYTHAYYVRVYRYIDKFDVTTFPNGICSA